MSTSVLIGIGIGGSLGALLLGILIWWVFRQGKKSAEGDQAKREAAAWQEQSNRQAVSDDRNQAREKEHVKNVEKIVHGGLSSDDVGSMLSTPIASKKK